jgi:hypothetical protein
MFIVFGLDSYARIPPIEEVTSLSRRLQGPSRRSFAGGRFLMARQVSSSNLPATFASSRSVSRRGYRRGKSSIQLLPFLRRQSRFGDVNLVDSLWQTAAPFRSTATAGFARDFSFPRYAARNAVNYRVFPNEWFQVLARLPLASAGL